VEISVSLASPSWYVQSSSGIVAVDTVPQGQNLILNMNDKGFNVVAFNRTTSKVDHFLENEAKGKWLAC
jgi:6-phosphogluconate dehydrogenase